MRAVALDGAGRLEVVERPDPEPEAGEVVVKVERCGICGSDLHLQASGLLPPGVVLGHEMAGTVAEVGSGVASLHEGQAVAVLPSTRCGNCSMCRGGREHLCPAQHSTVLGLGLNDGGYAEYVRTPAASCHPLPVPAAATFDHGALIEPYAVALHALNRSRIAGAGGGPGGGPDRTVGVIGAGSVGLMCVAALRRAGVERVAVAEPNRRRSAAAAAMGAVVVDDGRHLPRALGGGPEVIFDTSGHPSTTPLAVEVVAPGGQVVLLGVVGPTDRLPMPGLLWVVKEVEVTASIAYTDAEFAESVAAVGAGAVDEVAAHCEVRPLDQAQRCFEELRGPEAPAKILLAPQQPS